MKKIWMTLLLTAACFLGGLAANHTASAITTNEPQYAASPYMAPALAPPKHPTKVTLTGSGAVACTQFLRADGGPNPGACIRLQANVDLAYDVGSYLPDGGAARGDGTYNTNADGNQLSTPTVEAFCLKPWQDAICFSSTTAGSAYPAVRY